MSVALGWLIGKDGSAALTLRADRAWSGPLAAQARAVLDPADWPDRQGHLAGALFYARKRLGEIDPDLARLEIRIAPAAAEVIARGLLDG